MAPRPPIVNRSACRLLRAPRVKAAEVGDAPACIVAARRMTTAVCNEAERRSLAGQEVNQLRNDLIGRFLHQPVARALHDDPFDVRRDQPGLLDQELRRTPSRRSARASASSAASAQAGEVGRRPARTPGTPRSRRASRRAAHRPSRRSWRSASGTERFGSAAKSFQKCSKIDPLASGDERQRRLAVEVEVPEVAQQPDVLPVADAGQERVHQHDAVDLGRELRAHRHRRPSGRCRGRRRRAAAQPEARHQPHGRPAPCVALVVAAGPASTKGRSRAGRATMTVRVRASSADQRAPHVAGLGVAVQQQDRLAASRRSSSGGARR